MIADLKPYPSMKESGVEWLENIPEHWRLPRLGALLRERGETNGDGQVSEVLSVLRERGVIPYAEKGNIGNKKSEDITRYKVVRPDDIVVNCMNVIIGSVGLSRYTGCLSPVYYVLTRRSEHDHPRYLNAYFQTKPFQESLARIGNGILAHRMRIPMELLKCEPFPRPSFEEQAAIVRFLDHADRRIRRYIRAKQKLITLLEEQKQAIIHQAVTGQVDVRTGQLYPAYKPSGVEWLGDVPKHWEVNKVTRLFSIGSGSTPPTEHSEYYGGGIPWITTSELREAVIGSTKKTITEEALKAFPTLNIYPEGSIVIAMYGATIGRLGILGVPAAVNQACCVFSAPNGMYAWFWFYWFQSKRRYLISLGYGGGQPNLSQELLKSLRVPTPSFAEQRTISAYLDKATFDIADAINRAHREIDLLREYHTRLIADVVTGKLDVRESAAQLLDEVEELEPLDEAEVIINGEEEPSDGLDATPEEATV